jgi:Cd2+/Zn2+-exporting ATPase
MTTMAGASARFVVKGMDCAACVTKIESAVKRIDSVASVKVGLHSETLTVEFAGEVETDAVERAVRALGYRITPNWPQSDTQGRDAAADEAPEGRWWQSGKGRLVILSGITLALAYIAEYGFGRAGPLLFLVAAALGVIPVATRAVAALRQGSFFTIEMLMSIAVAGAALIGAVEEAAIVVFLFAIGELLEGVAAGRALAGIKALAKIAPRTALVETDSGLVETPVGDIAVGSIVVVRPGDRVPADGEIVSGASAVDQSALTGESVPLNKVEGDSIFAGSINTEAVLRIRVDKPAEDTLIARVVRLVEEAADSKAPSERFIERFARWYMPVICALAFAVAVLPPLLWQEPWGTWIYRSLTLLLIGCPCALVISTPAAVAAALAAGARRGLLVKGGRVLEAIGKVKHIAFDKTGTLTNGRPVVTDVVALGAVTAEEILRLAAAVESGSSHPLAAAIVSEARARNLTFALVTSQVLPGKGVAGRAEGRIVTVGAPGRLNVTDQHVLTRARGLETEGKSVSVVLSGREAIGLIAMRDEPRRDAVEAIREIVALGLKPVMLTGDNRTNAEAVGRMIGMDVKAELLPEDKLAVIRERAADGGIAKVGDGINDAPALAAATVGIAMGSGTDVALEAADAAVLNNRIADVAALVRLSRRTLAIIRQNVILAICLKLVFLLTTILGITGLWIAILADTGATVLVTLNALRLLRQR